MVAGRSGVFELETVIKIDDEGDPTFNLQPSRRHLVVGRLLTTDHLVTWPGSAVRVPTGIYLIER